MAVKTKEKKERRDFDQLVKQGGGGEKRKAWMDHQAPPVDYSTLESLRN